MSSGKRQAFCLNHNMLRPQCVKWCYLFPPRNTIPISQQVCSHYPLNKQQGTRPIEYCLFMFITKCKAKMTKMTSEGLTKVNKTVCPHPGIICTTHYLGNFNREIICHDDFIKWKHFPRYWPYVRGVHRSPVNSPLKGQWHGALMFSLICA